MSFDQINIEADFKQLSQELVAGIPQLSKQWTDHNSSDFGVMMLEVYAYLADNYLYKVNRVDQDIILGHLLNFVIPDEKWNSEYIDPLDFNFLKLNEVLKKDVKFNTLLATAREYYNDPYRLVSEEDVTEACLQITKALQKLDGYVSLELEGLSVKKVNEYQFDVVPFFLKDDPESSEGDIREYNEKLIPLLQKGLDERKILGTQINVDPPQVVNVKNVFISLKFNTENSLWSKKPKKLVRQKVEQYFFQKLTKEGLEIGDGISLFELLIELEEMGLIDYVKRVDVTLQDGDKTIKLKGDNVYYPYSGIILVDDETKFQIKELL